MDKNIEPERSCKSCNVGSIIDVFYWQAAISSWNENGDKTSIINGLRENKPTPKFARVFLADFIEGNAKRKPILKVAQLKSRNRFIRGNYEQLFKKHKEERKDGAQILKGETPASLAISGLSKIYDLSEETIKGIVKRKNLR